MPEKIRPDFDYFLMTFCIGERGERPYHGDTEEYYCDNLVPVEVRVARLLVFLLLLGMEGSPVCAGRVVGGSWGSVVVGDSRRSVVICWVSTAVTRLLVLLLLLVRSECSVASTD